jgi:hypothetical protein
MLTIDAVDQDVFTALRTFLVSVLPTEIEVVQAQDNGVPLPLGNFVTMNNVGKKRTATNINTYVDTGSNPSNKLTETHIQFDIQLDFYGDMAGDFSAIAMAMFRDAYATDMFPINIQPLYADDPMQIPLIDGEAQYIQRWKSQAMIQYNPIITSQQDLAKSLTITPKVI